MLGHTAAKFGLSRLLRKLGKKYGFLYIKHFGYPIDPASRILARETLKLLKGEEKGELLDVGCSHGAFDFEIARKGYTVIGIDINRESIDVGNKIKEILGFENITFHHMDILGNRFDARRFDVILMFETLEHIQADEKVIQELNRILKDHGILFLSVPYAENAQEYENPVGACKTKEGLNVCIGEGGSHYRDGYNLKQIGRLMEESGFQVMKWDYLCLPKWFGASVLSFPFKYPLSLLWARFSRNRMKLMVVAEKLAE